MSSKQRSLRKISIISTLGGLLFGYDTGVLNGALPFMTQADQLNLTPATEGLVTSSLLFGAAFGSMVGGKLSDKYGRRAVIRALALIFFFSTLGCAMSPTAAIIIPFRFILGLAVGGASVIVPTFLAEMAPAHLRASIVSQNELMIVSGQLLAYCFNAGLGTLFGGNHGVWRYMIVVASIPSIALWFGMMVVPETPRWLAANGKTAKALEVLRHIRSEADAEAELHEINQTIAEERDLDKATFKDLSIPWIRRLVLIGMGIGFVQQSAGINVIMYYGTSILEKSGLGTNTALIANIANGLVAVLAALSFVYITGDRFGRKPLFIAGLTGTTTSMIAMSIFANVLNGSPYLPVAVISCTVVYLAFFQGCLGPLAWLVMSEIFPLRLRGLGMGISAFSLWICNFIVGLLFPIMLDKFGLSGSFIAFAVCSVIGAVFIHKFCPETRGKSLEEIEESFRHEHDADFSRNVKLEKN